MEWKIGEIFEYNSEWYQCIEHPGCYGCAFDGGHTCNFKGGSNCATRSDNKLVIFKKLEKVGEPFFNYQCGKWMQTYKLFEYTDSFIDGYWFKIYFKEPTQYINIEIKENKEDMEKKEEVLTYKGKKYKFVEGNGEPNCPKCAFYKLSNCECEIFKCTSSLREDNKNGYYVEINERLKPFDFEAAKAGKPVCTRDGRKARIICFDRKHLCYQGLDYPIVALISEGSYDESICSYTNDGLFAPGGCHNNDLMMLSETKEGWMNIYKDSPIYTTKEEAQKYANKQRKYITTIKVEYEE